MTIAMKIYNNGHELVFHKEYNNSTVSSLTILKQDNYQIRSFHI